MRRWWLAEPRAVPEQGHKPSPCVQLPPNCNIHGSPWLLLSHLLLLGVLLQGSFFPGKCYNKFFPSLAVHSFPDSPPSSVATRLRYKCISELI